MCQALGRPPEGHVGVTIPVAFRILLQGLSIDLHPCYVPRQLGAAMARPALEEFRCDVA
jgi:hypothetical protein